VGREVREEPPGLLAGGRHGDRPARRHDGQRGLVSGERAGAGPERRRGRVPRLVPAPRHRQRDVRDPTYYLFPEETTPIDTFGGRSFVIDYKGRIVGRQDYGAGSTYVGGVIDIEALRDHRARAQWDNWMKDLRTELYGMLYVYEKPIYPKNLYLKRAPMNHKEYREKVIRRQIRLMHDRGIWKKPER
jgi:hypothetical protein